MTQNFIGQITDTSLESGNDLAARLNAFDTAHKTNQAGATRPTGIGAGGVWSKDLGSSQFSLMIYDGAADGIVSTPNLSAFLAELLLPTSDGTAGQLLKTDGSGQLGFVSPSNIGAGQTWADLSASRVAGTWYQNTTGRSIFISILGRIGFADTVQVSNDGGTTAFVVGAGPTTASQSARAQGNVVVPDGVYYRATGGFTEWHELR
ncbi:hypothetical protein [Roseovarius sp.]